MASGIRFEWDLQGLMEICKSEGMRQALQSEAQKLANEANSNASMYVDQLHVSRKGFTSPPFVGKTKVLSGTAIGKVDANTIGTLANTKFKCLSSVNH